MSIYTKSGDNGFASTMNRRMIAKNNPIFALLGTLDELNSALGVARSRMPAEFGGLVETIQQDVIAFSGELAGGEKFADPQRVAGMESSIDLMMEAAGGFTGFIAPGASESGAALDLARSVARRAERELVASKQTGGVSREAMMWMNRLSDLLYAMARLMDANAPKAEQEAQMPEGSFLELALWLCRRVLDKAMADGLPVVTAACDAGANPVALMRADGAYIASVDIAQNKAYTSVSVQMTTEKLGTLCQPNGPLYGIQNTNGGRMVIFGGGIPLFRNGKLIGGFGVSGGSAEQDTALAHYAQDLFDKGGM